MKNKPKELKKAIENAKIAAISTRGLYPVIAATNAHYTDGTKFEGETPEIKPIDLSTLTLGSTFLFGRHQVNEEGPWRIEWEIIHQEDDYQIARTSRVIDFRAFDAKEPNNPISDRAYGNNNWLVSNIKQWLNSDAEAGNWYSAQHEYDVAPSNDYTLYNTGYLDRPGFLYHFTEEEKSFLLDHTLILHKNSADGGGTGISHEWAGKVFLPTYTNMGFGDNDGVTEGIVFNAFTNDESRTLRLHDKVFENTLFNYPGSKNDYVLYWLSSDYSDNTWAARSVNSNGAFGMIVGAQCGNFGIAPCIKLPREGIIEL